jgi:hypothetical protein
MLLVKVFVLVVLLVVMLVLLVLGVGWLRRWYPSLRRYEGRRWDPPAALGTLGFATAMYAGLSYTSPLPTSRRASPTPCVFWSARREVC